MPSSILSLRKKGALATWLSGKLAMTKKKLDAKENPVDTISNAGGCSPLIGNMDANNPRSKHKAKHIPTVTAANDCTQQIADSDQASAVAR